MLCYYRIYVSAGIDITKMKALTEYSSWHYWYFLDKEFKFQPYICNGCHDMLMLSMSLSNIAILSINGLVIAALLLELAKVIP